LQQRNKNIRTILIYLAILGALAWAVAVQVNRGTPSAAPTKLTTGQFVTAVKEKRVKSVEYKTEDGSLAGEFWQKKADQDAAAADKKLKKFTSTWAGNDAFAEFAQRESFVNYTINNKGQSIWITILSSLLPTVLLIGMMIFFLNQIQGGNRGVMNFGRARAKRNDKEKQKITFADVAGVDEAIAELGEVKDFLSNPARFEELGARIPKGVLLVGPPGTGKTLLARAVAGEADVPFFTISGSDFVEMFVGVGASRVRDLFEQAKAEAPAIIFMDEIDAVGRQRGTGLGGGHDEREQTLNALLVEMDGFEMQDNVILIAATNRPDVLDPALLRPGRFDRQIVVDRPDLKGREAILRIHAKNKPMADDVDLSVIARRTPGFTGADLRNLLNEAALLAARAGKQQIDMTEVEEGIDRVLMGPERKSRLISDDEKRTIAFHESGHAIVGHFLPNSDPVHKVTIIPRGGSLGSTWQLPTEDRFLTTKKEMLDDIAVLLSGRAAEQLTSGDITTGASNDIERASKIAKDMVTRFGMSDRLGPQAFGDQNEAVFLGRDFSNNIDYAEETAAVIDQEIARIVSQGYDRATDILERENALLHTMADKLIEKETLEGDELKALFNSGNGTETPDSAEAQDRAETPEGAEAQDHTETPEDPEHGPR
jgi:cell division protease FtsH